MIIGVRHKGLEAFYCTGSLRGIQSAHAKKLAIILLLLDVAQAPDELNLPALHLHPLKRNLIGHWSIWVTGNWRVRSDLTEPMSSWLIIKMIVKRKIDMMHNHLYPSETLRTTVFEPLGLTVSDAAERLGMFRPALSRVLNGKAGISPALAIRLEKAGVSTAWFWISL